MLDVKKFVDQLHSYIQRAILPISDRVKALEERQPERGEKGDPGERGPQGERGADGESAKVEDVAAAVMASSDLAALVARAVAAHFEANPVPPGKDGRDGADGAPGERGPPGEKGMDGADGVGLAGAVIDRTGALVITTTKGEAIPLGVVVGRDGAPGKDGRDGLDLRHFKAEQVDERNVTLTLSDGERTERAHLTFPVVIDRGVYSEAGRPGGGLYEKGDGVTYGGSYWIAQVDGPEGAPGLSKDWRLAVKKGRDGKDGRNGIDKTAPVKVAP